MNYFEQKVYNYIQTHGLIEPGNRLVVGVSGGADSVCPATRVKGAYASVAYPFAGHRCGACASWHPGRGGRS